ncbi:MAG: TonB-dependent receptor [Bacteroidetes bacterium]|nr:MAG: TonB-dependent receptor [Bacteroidota bacterium]
MKSILFYIIYFCFSLFIFAQKSNGKIISSVNSVSISDVTIISLDSTLITKSDNQGVFYVPKSGVYLFSKDNYLPTNVYINEDSFNTVELSPRVENLNEIVILSNNFQQKLKHLPTAISVLDSHEISSNNNVNIAPILNTISGIYMHNGTLTTNRITIRGIGSRNLFGTSKIRAYYEDIPLTNGSGASTIEDTEMNTLGNIEILKGPSSSIYGAGLGGTIQLIPDKGLFNTSLLKTSYMLGSYGLQKYMLQGNVGDHKNSAKVTYSNLSSDGYRENNETKRQNITLASKHFISSSDKLIFIGNYTDLKAFIPSSINEDDFINNPTNAAFTWSRSKGFEDYKKGLFGLSWEHVYNEKLKQKTSVFSTFLNSYEPRPFNILQEKTRGFGLRTRMISNIELFKSPLNWTLGAEVFKDHNSYQTYENLYDDFPPETGSVKGNLLSDFKEKRSYLNFFFDSDYELSNKTHLSFGLNINTTTYKLSDFYNDDDLNFSGDYKFKTIASPKFGITHDISKSVILYSSISHGFSPPSLEETLLPDGLINSDIKPESGWNYEIGSRGTLLNANLQFDLALYKMNVKNLLVARRTADDQFIGVNAGKTTYNGIELTLNYKLLNTNSFNISTNNAFTFNDFKFKTFIDDNSDYSGNDLTGVPEFSYNSRLNFETKFGLYGIINYNYVGEIPMRDDNTIYSDNYQLIHSKIGYKSNETKKLRFNIFIGFNNIFNENYASMLLINASGFGGSAPRYYYPGEPSNYYTGLSIIYDFKSIN